VELGGTLALGFDPTDVPDPSALVGMSWQLFDWTNAQPLSDFDDITSVDPNAVWDTSDLYTTGVVTLEAYTPEPASIALAAGLFTISLMVRRRGNSRPSSAARF
jgi:hypothetical protein